jgi:metal-responsive CopG/Arc/MetJ family transcriptional regulator
MPTKFYLTVTVDKLLVERLDQNRDKTQKISRSSLVEAAIRHYLPQLENPEMHNKKALLA